jgi:RNA polymerase sigma factor (sigma-70 family)
MNIKPNETRPARLDAFEQFCPRIHLIAYRILGNRADAEDVVQDTFVKWCTSRVDEVLVPAAWLTTVATRLAIDRLRRTRRECTPLSDAVLQHVEDASAPSAEALATRASELSHGVRLLLERLSAEERTALLLHEAFDADYASIAKTLGRTPANCRQIVHRAKGRILTDKPRAAATADAVSSLVDAIAAQDLEAVVALSRGDVLAAPVSQARLDVAATLETAALIVRLRRGALPLGRIATSSVCCCV